MGHSPTNTPQIFRLEGYIGKTRLYAIALQHNQVHLHKVGCDDIISIRRTIGNSMCENCVIDTLIITNISSEQIPPLIKELNKEQFYFTQIASSGGLFHMSTNTLLIGIQGSRYDKLIDLLHTYCKRKPTHITTQTQMEAYFQPSQPIIIEAETGGATILTLPVEHFEQY